MPTPAHPFLPSDASSTDAPKQQAHNHDGGHSPAAWVGVSICAIMCLAWILRYSYLASPFWLHRMRRRLGIRPASRTPISHHPTLHSIGTESPPPWIARPEPAYFRIPSKDTLPVYQPTNQFSSDVLEALLNLGPAAGGARPPSYRSKLPQEWRSAMGTRTRTRDDEESEFS
ncbi:uncharacterized protein Z519_05772 [Cladophialophora bantiana CBS 173.52]|uniref:Uncharacterized protein n=1 Tax=Cladophialophora bantiana (strain ATCC 10958 / CBS 173.52 / CDC B-1940 / NIH 8579) TaxID=1442370 RepID=A0A0D2G397_CLAB1|nr:uncharacterized protein Z519_05772 [Cladophialophora bantiana CBS 173.52]KIW93167.1 hypothetical protein Z519_05772 [Cladophialophora bantiana CBS 173.52]